MGSKATYQRRPPKDPELMEWWAVMEHPTFGEARVLFRWRRDGRHGGYAAVVTAVEFDLFTPADEQAELIELLQAANVRVHALPELR